MISYRLFIEGEELVLNEDVQVAITKQFEDVSNPTTIINDWSKTVNIPICPRNNKIFGHIYDPKKIIVSSSSNQKLTGIYFDPTKKLDFRLEYGSSVVMVGYAKMNSVTQQNGKGSYNITLNGELGKVFQELQKISFNINDENSDYVIDGGQYVSGTINRTLVNSSWTSTGQTHTGLSGATITDIIGFAPNNSYYEEFDPKSYQSPSNGDINTFEDVLKGKWDDGNGGYVTHIEPGSVIPDGLLPRDIGEFRSYYQLPYIYWNKLWRIFQAKAEQVTGYTWNLDSSWFKTTNPYWYNLVYMLKPFNVKDGTNLENNYSKWTIDRAGTGPYDIGKSNDVNSPATKKLLIPQSEAGVQSKSEAYPLLPMGYEGEWEASRYPHTPTNVAVFRCPSDFTSITYKWTMGMRISTGASGSKIDNNNGLLVSVKMYGCDLDESNPNSAPYNTRLVQTNNFLVVREGSSFTYGNATRIETGSSQSSGSNRYTLPFSFNTSFFANSARCGTHCYFTVDVAWVNGNSGGLGNEGYTYFNTDTVISSVQVNLSSGAFRSDANFTLNDLWDNEYNVFDQILNYCKMYRILVFADHVNKQLKFITAANYFRGYTVKDWTDKVDISKDFTVTPLTFDSKYVLFNYKDNDSKLGEKYKESWGVNYGEKKIITNYNFNQEEKNLFEKDITSSITNTDFSLSWSNLYDRNTISYSLPAEIFPYAKDDSNKHTDNFGAFFFHNGRRNFDTTAALHMRSTSLTDDTVLQSSTSTFVYSQSNNSISVSTYPALDIISSDGEKLCIFNTPNENFTYAKNLGGTKGLYDIFWKYYLEERYNIQNKQVTCYLKLDPTDFINFDYKNFVTIDGTLYMVNKIYDYNIASNKPTKVDLITIQDPTNYYVDVYNDYLNVSPSTITFDVNSQAGDYYDITVDAYNNAWDYKVYDSEGNEVESTTYKYAIQKMSNTKIRVTKYGDYAFDLYITVFTKTKRTSVKVHSSRSLYINWWPSDGWTVTKGNVTEFEIYVETNYYDVMVGGDNVSGVNIQRWNENRSTWVTNFGQAADYWLNAGYEDAYNENYDDRHFTAKFRTNNPTAIATGHIDLYPYDDIAHAVPSAYKHVPVNVVEPNQLTLEFTEKNLDYHTGGTFGITGFSSSAWEWTMPSGVTTYGGSSGEAGNISTTINVSSGQQPDTTKLCVIRNTEGMSVTLAIHFVNRYVSITDSEGNLIADEYVEYHGYSSTRGYKVYASGPWELTLPQEAHSRGATSGTGNVTGGEDITIDWGTAYPGTVRSAVVSLTGISPDDVHQSIDCHYVTEENMPT